MTAINLETRKLQIIQAVLAAKEGAVLDNIERLASLIGTKKEEEENIEDLGFWLDGEKVTEANFYERLNQNKLDKKNGKYMPHEAFEKEAQNW